MKIGILTLPFNTNIGGILQAYALQTTLQSLGHEVCVIDKLPPKVKFSYTKMGVVRLIQRYILRQKDSYFTPKMLLRGEYYYISQNTQRFIDQYINKLSCSSYASLPKDCVEAIVVGSDQVWRAQYFGRIEDAYLDFARGWSIKRVAYAPSFGSDELEPSQVKRIAPLISKFDAVSVREESAINLCKSYLGVDAQQMVDPTMLLEKQHYIDLIRRATTHKSGGNMMVCMLDRTPDKQCLIDSIAQQKSLTPFSVNAVEEQYAPNVKRVQCSVEQWLRSFEDSQFVVADSFHACVFAIIFNKPFVAYANRERGASRFISLLKIFGLERLLVHSSEELNLAEAVKIDWSSVNTKLRECKSQSLNFLKI